MTRYRGFVLILLFLCLSLSISQYLEAGDGKKQNKRAKGSKKRNGAERKKRFDANPQKIAMEVWASTLTDKDYNDADWRTKFHSSSTADFFNGYAKIISDIFKENDAKVNFAMVGKSITTIKTLQLIT